MKNRAKKLLSLTLVTALLAALLTGCSRSDSGIDPNAVAYFAEYQDIDFGNSYIGAVIARGDLLYFFTNDWNEETMTAENTLHTVSLADGTHEKTMLAPFGENSYVNNIALDAEGNLLMLSTHWREDGGSEYVVYTVTPAGQTLGQTDISETLNLGQNNWLQNMYSDKEGNLYFVISGDSNVYQVVAFDSNLNLKGKVEHNNYIDNFICTDSGEVYITSWGDGAGMILKKADFQTGQFGPDIALTGLSRFGSMRFAPGGGTGLLAADGNSLYEYDVEGGVATKILDLLDCDINANDMRYFGEVSDGSYWLVNQTYNINSTKTELAILKETTYGELPPREYLTYGALYMNSNIRQAIVDFNKTNGKYRIRIEEFYNGEDWEAGQIAFNTALTRTDAPDMIDLTSANFAQLVAQKALEDLNPHFDKSELNRDDYLESAFNAYTVDGKLYAVMTEFSVGSLAGHASKLEGIDSWTMTEMIEWAKRYPEAKLTNGTSTSILYELVFMSLDKFIDWESGKCDFTSDEFIEILDFAATFGNDYDNYDYNDPDRIGTHEGLQTGKYLLLSNTISDLNAMQMMDAMFDGEAKYIGYPTESGSGIYFAPSGALCISAKSRHKEGAFAFISYLLSDAYQKGDEGSYRYGIPVNKAAIEAMIVTATTPPPGETATTSVSSWGWDDLNVQIFAAKNANYVDTFWDLLNRASGYRGGYETQINTIIQEETEAFFAGQKSAREVAEIVQSRVQIYVNELR